MHPGNTILQQGIDDGIAPNGISLCSAAVACAHNQLTWYSVRARRCAQMTPVSHRASMMAL